jgi:hypothetical protein
MTPPVAFSSVAIQEDKEDRRYVVNCTCIAKLNSRVFNQLASLAPNPIRLAVLTTSEYWEASPDRFLGPNLPLSLVYGPFQV